MNQNPIVDDDLQKAINDITNSTNADPVFADPVASPEPTAPVQATAVVEEIAPAPAPTAPIPEPATPEPPMPEPSAPASESATPDFGTPAEMVESTSIESIAPVELATPDASSASAEESTIPPAPMDINDIKTAALNDLTPLLNEVAPHLKDANIKPTTKFDLYKKIITELGDHDAIGTAYETANQIEDGAERSEALLSLVEIIDQL